MTLKLSFQERNTGQSKQKRNHDERDNLVIGSDFFHAIEGYSWPTDRDGCGHGPDQAGHGKPAP
jgi:hypothetical protein